MAGLAQWLLSPGAAVLQWSVCLGLELCIVTALSLFCVMTFTQLMPAASFVAGFYLLARSLTAIQLMSASPLAVENPLSHQFMTWMIDGLSLVLPALDRFTQSVWLADAAAGWPAVGIEIKVVDPNGAEVPRDSETMGEIITRCDNVMDGYFREPEATAAVLRDGWFHTGDMAVWDEEGYLKIVDRKKEIIISGGENISSIEVEKSIYAHPAVLECAVVAAPDAKWGEVPAALVVCKDGHSLTAEELIQFLETRLGRFKLPRIVSIETEALPKTGTGKIRKNILRERFWAGKDKRIN